LPLRKWFNHNNSVFQTVEEGLDGFRQVEMLLESTLRGSVELYREIEDQLEPILRETSDEIVTGWLARIPSEILGEKTDGEVGGGPVYNRGTGTV
jgi:hypothetical protein